MAFQGLGSISAPPKRSDDRSRTRLFPNPVAWKGCRFDSAAGCPRASLRPEEAADLVGQVLGDLDESTGSCSKLLEQRQLRSLFSELGQHWLWVHCAETKPLGTSRSMWTADSHEFGVPEMLRRKELFAQPTNHMKMSLNADLLQSRAEDLCVEH